MHCLYTEVAFLLEFHSLETTPFVKDTKKKSCRQHQLKKTFSTIRFTEPVE